MTNQDMENKIALIGTLNKEDLYTMATAVNLSNADKSIKTHLNLAIDKRAIELNKNSTNGLIVEHGEDIDFD